jgi:hypothetical protein
MMKFNIFHRIMPAAAMIICIYEFHCSSSSSSAITPVRIDGIMNEWERLTLTTSTDQTQRSLRGRIKEDISLEGSSESRDVLIVNHEMTRSAALDNQYDEIMIAEDLSEELDETNPENLESITYVNDEGVTSQVQAEA